MAPRKRLKASAVSSGAHTVASVANFHDLPKLQKDVLSIVDSMYGLRHASSADIHSEPKGLLVAEAGAYPFPICWGGTFIDIAQRVFTDTEKFVAESASLAFNLGLTDACDGDEFLQHFCKMDVIWCQHSKLICFFFLCWACSNFIFWFLCPLFLPRFFQKKLRCLSKKCLRLNVCALSCIEVWPPEKGSTFDTSVLCWSFQEASFWRGNSVAMAEVVTLARSIAANRFREAGNPSARPMVKRNAFQIVSNEFSF